MLHIKKGTSTLIYAAEDGSIDLAEGAMFYAHNHGPRDWRLTPEGQMVNVPWVVLCKVETAPPVMIGMVADRWAAGTLLLAAAQRWQDGIR